MPITSKTVVCAVIGDPIHHSLSPNMHNAAFQCLNLDYVYLAFRVQKENLGEAISGFKALNFCGFNVTIPHKEECIKYLDEIDETALKIGAVNCVVNENGILKGYNTDGIGALRVVTEGGFELDGKKITILGAGGAARAIVFTFAKLASKINILNRTFPKAKKLVEDVLRTAKILIIAKKLSYENLKESILEAELLVNTTSVGMCPKTEETIVPQELLHGKLTVFDAVYNPPETRLLREAKSIGAKTIDGIDMLVYQGAEAFEKWTGKKAPIQVMKKTVLKSLKKK
ncbi:MAG: shikimate dehydrogenase [Candidatus Hodarchaeota archaeon]